jgi:hypothetical protein
LTADELAIKITRDNGQIIASKTVLSSSCSGMILNEITTVKKK